MNEQRDRVSLEVLSAAKIDVAGLQAELKAHVAGEVRFDRLSRALAARLERPDAARFHAAAIRRRAFEQFTAERSTARWFALYDRLLTPKETVRED